MRCETCGRRWSGSARFCGRCGAQLGEAQGDRSTSSPESRRPGRRPIAWAAALGVIVTLLVAAAATVAGDAPSPDRSSTAVSIPGADPDAGSTRVEAADRAPRPADCGDHLQDLPRPIRHYGLYTGRLEWRDGRLCSPLSPDELHGDAQPRCEPPDTFACAIP